MKLTMENVQKIYDANKNYCEKVRDQTPAEETTEPDKGLNEAWDILLHADGTAKERVFVSSTALDFAQAGLSMSRYRKCLEVCGVEVIG